MPEPETESADDAAAQRVDALFEALPATLKAEAAGDWEATIQFEIEGLEPRAIAVASGEASLREGSVESPDGTVTFDGPETLLEMASGELDPQKAFMAGRVESDDMDVLMKFGEYFDLEAAASQLDTGDDEATDEPDGEGLNHDCIGKKYRDSARIVEAEEILEYADATENDHPRHVDTDREGGVVAPPLFAVRLFHPLLEEVMHDDELNADLLRLVHGEQDMTFHEPIEPKDLVAARAEITSIVEKSSGELINIHFRLMREGECIVEADTVLFIRAESDASDDEADDADREGTESNEESAADDAAEEPSYLAEAEQYVAADQPERYAEASGDHNPIHLDPEVAEAAGLPGVILHGLCTMAFASNAVVEHACDGDATALERLAVRFSKPVFPEQTVTTRIWSEGSEDEAVDYRFDAVDEAGDPVLQMGRAETRS